MKSLQESLFDKDLVQKNLGTLDVITGYIRSYLDGKHTENRWEECLEKIGGMIDFKLPGQWKLNRNDNARKIKDDELYVHINPERGMLIMVGDGLIGEWQKDNDSTPAIIIKYNLRINNIYIDVYRSGMLYRDLLSGYKFNYYKLDKKSVENFVDNVFDKIEQVF